MATYSNWNSNSNNSEFSIKYFDTLPVAIEMAVLKSGHLFWFHKMDRYIVCIKLLGLGDDPNQPEYTSISGDIKDIKDTIPEPIITHAELVNLVECDSLPHFGSVTSGHILNLGKRGIPILHVPQGIISFISFNYLLGYGTARILSLEFSEAQNVTGAWSTENGHVLLSMKDSTSALLSIDLEQGAVEQIDPKPIHLLILYVWILQPWQLDI